MRLDFDPHRNLLVLTMQDSNAPVAGIAVPGLVDMAAGGRLIGVELALSESLTERALLDWQADGVLEIADSSAYVPLTRGPDDDQARSTPVELVVELDGSGALVALGIPRRGAGYEISYPSGNR